MNNKEPGYVNILTNPSFREDGFEIDKSIHPVEVMELRKNQQPVPLIIDGPCDVRRMSSYPLIKTKNSYNMKPKQTFIIVLLLLIIGSMKVHAQTLVLWHSDGTTTDVELFTQPNVRFVKDKVLVTSSVANLEYDEKDIIRFTYKGKSTGITSPLLDSDYSQESGQIIFHNVKATDKIGLYKANGIRIPVRLTLQDNSATLPLSSIPSGIYLLNINGHTSKFTKK